jgi:hypothetical protein
VTGAPQRAIDAFVFPSPRPISSLTGGTMTFRPALALTLFLGAVAPAPALWAENGPDEAVALWEADRTRIFDASEVRLEDFTWIARPVVVFADTPADPRFRQQMELIERRIEELAIRDVVVIVDTDPAARSSVRMTLRPRGFMLALVNKEGGVFQRKPAPWDVREITRAIDKLPQRQQELRDGTAIRG